ncbi:cupin domain-containing protein [Microdochium nivale]|nr:cupin domain-containing protein [Microdochium nivale]
MAGLLSLLPDILPMIVPASIHVTKARDLAIQRQGNDSPMLRQGAVIGKSDKMCATVLIARANCASAVHHHGEQDTMIYAVSGTGILVTNNGDETSPRRQELSAGDFAMVPSWTEHQEINDTDEDFVWILIRSGPEPVVVYLTDFFGKVVPAD